MSGEGDYGPKNQQSLDEGIQSLADMPDFENRETETTVESAENMEESRENKARSLFEQEYKGEKEFGPQGMVDYWAQLKDNLLGIFNSVSEDASDEEIQKKREEAMLIENKASLILEYLEKDAWGDELQEQFGWGDGRKADIENMLQQGMDAEAIYSRLLMGGRDPNWVEGENWLIHKYGFLIGYGGPVEANYIGKHILSDGIAQVLEEHGVKIDGHDLFRRMDEDDLTYIPDEKLDFLVAHGVNTDDIVGKIEQNDEDRKFITYVEKFDFLTKNGVDVDLQKMTDGISSSAKVGVLELLHKHNIDVDIMQFIKEVSTDEIAFMAHKSSKIEAIMGYGGIKALDEMRSKIDSYYEGTLLLSAGKALECYGLTEGEIKEKERTDENLIFLHNIESYDIRIDADGKYCQRKTTEDGRYYYDYDSDDVKKFVALREDKDFFKNVLKYNTGKPEWSLGSKYDDWEKHSFYDHEEISRIIESYATEDVVNDPQFVEYFAQGYSYPAGKKPDVYEEIILGDKMSPSNADKVIKRCQQNGIEFEDHVMKNVYDEETKEKKKTNKDLNFLLGISAYNIAEDADGKYCQRKVAEDGRYYYDYDSDDVKRFTKLKEDKNFFKNVLKYNTGRPEDQEKIFEIIHRDATKDVINDPQFVEYFAQACSHSTGKKLDAYTGLILRYKMSPSNADKVIKRCQQNGVKIEDYVLKAIYGSAPNPIKEETPKPESIESSFADNNGFRDW